MKKLLVMIIGLTLILCGCQGKNDDSNTTISFDYAQYNTQEELKKASDLIVRGEILSKVEREIDIANPSTEDPVSSPSEDVTEYIIPYMVYEVEVSKTYKGTVIEDEIIEIKVPIHSDMSDTLDFEVEEAYVFFLATYDNVPASLLNMSQAHYKLDNDMIINHENNEIVLNISQL